ncbi:MAG: serine acetyltransferase [Alphaproteobacteria bacterium]|nr:MAG: serine acetyltransferase [Alphaproteobacteria bacterium]
MIRDLPKTKFKLYKTLKLDFKTDRFWVIIRGSILRHNSRAVLLYRLSSYFQHKGKIGGFFSMFFWQLNIIMHSCEISPTSVIGVGLTLTHPMGVVIGDVHLGNNIVIYQNVTIGSRRFGLEFSSSEQCPTIGNNVILYTGAVIVGPVHIGDNARIGANTVIITDVPEKAVVTSTLPHIKLAEAHG